MRGKLIDANIISLHSLETYLSAALDNIKGANGGVRNTAGKNASNHALAIVASVVNVTHLLCLDYLV